MATIASVSTSNVGTDISGTGDVVLTKPTGLTSGDLMVAAILTDRSTSSYTTPSGWTKISDAEHLQGAGCCTAFYKYADAGDVAASDFTFETVGTSSPLVGGGALYRITDAPTSDPLLTVNNGIGPGNETTVAITETLEIIGSESILIMMALQSDSTAYGTASSYYVTGGASPTFTERSEYVNTGDEESLHLADAVYSSGDDITAYGWDTAENISFQRGILIAIPTQANASAENTFFTTDTENFSGTGITSASATSDLVETTTETFSQTGRASKTQWTNEARPSLSQSLQNSVGMDGNNRVYMDGSNKIYRSASTRNWTNETRP